MCTTYTGDEGPQGNKGFQGIKGMQGPPGNEVSVPIKYLIRSIMWELTFKQ